MEKMMKKVCGNAPFEKKAVKRSDVRVKRFQRRRGLPNMVRERDDSPFHDPRLPFCAIICAPKRVDPAPRMITDHTCVGLVELEWEYVGNLENGVAVRNKLPRWANPRFVGGIDDLCPARSEASSLLICT